MVTYVCYKSLDNIVGIYTEGVTVLLFIFTFKMKLFFILFGLGQSAPLDDNRLDSIISNFSPEQYWSYKRGRFRVKINKLREMFKLDNKRLNTKKRIHRTDTTVVPKEIEKKEKTATKKWKVSGKKVTKKWQNSGKNKKTVKARKFNPLVLTYQWH